MGEETSFVLSWWILVVAGVFVAGGAFAVIYWMMGRGKDDDSA